MGAFWSPKEIRIIREYYPKPEISWERLLQLLPNRKDYNISRKASGLGLHRRRTTKRPKNPVFARLWEIREEAGITRNDLAEIMGYHPFMIGRWERGDATPSWQRVQDWCEGLGVQLVVREKK